MKSSNDRHHGWFFRSWPLWWWYSSLINQCFMLSQIKSVRTVGVCCFWRCAHNTLKALVCVLSLASLGHHRTWFVSSHNWPHSKQWPSCLLSKVCSHLAVGRMSFRYFDNWMHQPVGNFCIPSPMWLHAVLPKMLSFHCDSRFVAVWDCSMRYPCIRGSCATLWMYVSISDVIGDGPWKRAALVPGIHVGNIPIVVAGCEWRCSA